MALALVLDSLDGVAEAVHSEYIEKDGKFFLDTIPGGGLAVEDVSGLKSSLSAARGERDNALAKLRGFGDITPEKAAAAIARQAEFDAFDPDAAADEKVKARMQQIADKNKEELAGRDQTIESLTTQLEKNLVVAAATEALQEAKGNIALLMPHVRSQIRMRKTDSGEFIAEVIDGSNNPRVGDSSGNPMTIPQLVEEMKGMDQFAPAFEGTGQTGSGSSGKDHEGPVTVGGKKTIKRSDQAGMDAHIDEIASGEVVVVD